MMRLGTWLGLMVLAWTMPLLAADESTQADDFRGPVVLAYTLVFLLVIVYLVMSHNKNAKLGEEIDFLRRRVDELEKK